MRINTFFLDIPKTSGLPAKIFVKVVSMNDISLKSQPFIFIFPGGPGANHSHYEAYNCLSTHGNLVFFDPRGCGLSSKANPSTYTLDNYIDDVEKIRQHLNLKEIIVLGKSCGAIAALAFTLRYSSVVSKLILSAGAASYRFLETAKNNVLAHGSQQQIEVCEKLWQGAFSSDEEAIEFLKIMAPLYSYKAKLGVLSHSSTPLYPISHEPLNYGFKHFLREFNFEKQLSLIHCETLILAGKEDWIMDSIHSEYMSHHIRKNLLIVFPESSHMMEIDVPTLYFNAIKEFIVI